MYLQSLLESRSKNRLNFLQSDNNTLGQQPVEKSLLGNSDSTDLPVLCSETNQSLESRRTDSEVFEEAKHVENGDVADPVKTNVVEKVGNGDFLNEDKDDDDMKKKDDDNMENMVALSNSEAQNMEKK